MLLDIVPNNKRNGFYSILPTLALLFASVLNYYGGSYIAENGYVNIILLLMVIELAGGLLVAFITIFFGFRELEVLTPTSENVPYVFQTSLNDTDRLGKEIKRFRPSDWYISETTKRIWERLMKVARQDGTITEAEMTLLVDGMAQLKDYMKALDSALRDGIVQDYEGEFLKKKREELMEYLTTKAKEDGEIDKDEDQLIALYGKILDELHKVEAIAK